MDVTDVSTIILASVILYAIFAIMANRANERRIRKMGKTMPGPPQWPLLGNTFYITQKLEDLVDVMTSMFDSYPSIYQLRVGPLLMVNINDPDLTKKVMVEHKLLERAYYVEMLFKSAIGTNLITAPSAIWRIHRKIMGPAFNTTFLRNFMDVFDTQSKIMVKQLEVHQDGPEFDMDHYISSCMLDIIIETVMNVKLGTQTNQNHELKRAIDKGIENTGLRFFRPWLHRDFLFNLSPLGVRHAKCIKIFHGFAKRVIEEEMEEMTHQRLRSNFADHGEHAGTTSIQKRTLLHLLMDCDNGQMRMQSEEIIDELMTVLVAALDTTATAINMLMFALACYPDVQKKVHEEVMEVCGKGEDDGQTITVDQLNNLAYLERVIKETLRLFPTVSLIPRDVTEDITIGDYYVPKGAVVNIALFALHRNEKFWPDPLKFDPDRFLPEEVEKRHPYAYIPFGAGPRNCIGARYAMMTMKIMSARVVQKYALEKDHPKNIANTKLKIGITTKACDPVTIRLRKRQGNIAKA